MFDRYNRPIHVIQVDETTTTIKHNPSDVCDWDNACSSYSDGFASGWEKRLVRFSQRQRLSTSATHRSCC